MNEEKITLYPSNWLYNAGVVGFLRVLELGMGREYVEKNLIKEEKIDISGLEWLWEKTFKNTDIKDKIVKESIPQIDILNNLSLIGWWWIKKSFEKVTSIENEVYNLIYKDGSKYKSQEKKKIKNNLLELKDFKFTHNNVSQEFSFKVYKNNTNSILDKFFKGKESLNSARKKIIREIEKIKDAWIYKKTIGYYFSQHGRYSVYQNLFNPANFSRVEKFKHFVQDIKVEKGNFSCNFCGEKIKTYVTFEFKHFTLIGATPDKFPNSFWNNSPNTLICKKCQFLILNHHLGFVNTKDGEIFVNTPHFGLTWDLNKFAEGVLKRDKEYETRKLLGSSLLEWAIKRRTLLGAWTMMNIEVIVKKRIKTAANKWEDIIDYFDLPYHITRILLDYEIANLIKRINEEKIFDLIISGKFSEIEKANYFVLRGLLKLKNNEDISENDPLTKYVSKKKDINHLKNISKLLPELYAKIIKILKMEVKHE